MVKKAFISHVDAVNTKENKYKECIYFSGGGGG